MLPGIETKEAARKGEKPAATETEKSTETGLIETKEGGRAQSFTTPDWYDQDED